jgi:hypothetical protein
MAVCVSALLPPAAARPIVWIAATILRASLRLSLQEAPTRRHIFISDGLTLGNAPRLSERRRRTREGRRSSYDPSFRTYEKAPPPLSIFYAEMEILRGTPTIHTRSWKMLSFMTSHTIALSQAKNRRKGFFSSVFDVLAEARMRRAEIEIEHHRRFYESSTK